MALVVCEDCSTRYAPDVERCPHCGSGTAVAEDVVEQRRPLLPVRVVQCRNSACPAVGITRRVPLRHAGPGVFEQPGLVCARCRAPMADVETSEEESMAKITVHGGPSNADDPDPVADPEQPEQPAGEDAESGGEQVADQTVDYETWTVSQLQVELAERGLPTTGKKAELQQRLADADAQPAPETG
jgi:hypothetical protein